MVFKYNFNRSVRSLVAALCLAAVAVLTLAVGPLPSPHVLMKCYVIVGLLTPVVWIATAVSTVNAVIVAAKIHAAAIALFIAMGLGSSPPDGSLGHFLGMFIALLLPLVILGIELLFIAACSARLRSAAPEAKSVPWLFRGLTLVLISGWALGTSIWALAMPSRIENAAAELIQGRPFCIEVMGRQTRAVTVSDIAAMARSRWNGGLHWAFHVLLVIEDTIGTRDYRNWSFRRGRFEPVSSKARSGLHLDASVKCKSEHNAPSLTPAP